MWVKICANTRLEDAVAAAEAGADAVGFVFAPSRRQVTAAQVAPMAHALPPGVERVGVFAGWTAREIADAVDAAGLDAVQVHDGYSPELAGALTEVLPAHIQRIWTVSWRLDGGAAAEHEVDATLGLLPAEAGRVLLDAKVGGVSGGLGQRLDWLAAGRLRARHPGHTLLLAGGLDPENVADAVRQVAPAGVDVASGVEVTPGVKDHGKVRAFIRAARGAENS